MHQHAKGGARDNQGGGRRSSEMSLWRRWRKMSWGVHPRSLIAITAAAIKIWILHPKFFYPFTLFSLANAFWIFFYLKMNDNILLLSLHCLLTYSILEWHLSTTYWQATMHAKLCKNQSNSFHIKHFMNFCFLYLRFWKIALHGKAIHIKFLILFHTRWYLT